MPKPPSILYSCSHCGAQFLKWAGRCTECGQWGTVAEQSPTERAAAQTAQSATHALKPQSFETLTHAKQAPSVSSGVAALDRLLGGGLVPGSVTLLGGEPGIGKSTVLSQVALAMAARGTVLYVAGEESPSQVLLRLQRLSKQLPGTLLFIDETDADAIAATIREQKPVLSIIDSVQTLRTARAQGEPGGVTQVKASSAIVHEAAKASGSPVVLVGQVNKDGDVAGPRLLEHLVDTVLMMEGDRYQVFRLLRVIKHRFGPTDELALFTMTEQGLQEVADPSASLISESPAHAPGTAISCLLEGSRPLLVELQALVTPSGFGMPTRRATGIDANRLSMLLAVLSRHGAVGFADQDVFANAIGGVEAREPALDLALAIALVSGRKMKALPPHTIILGELGLGGELRPVSQTALRLKEAGRLGFTEALIPAGREPITIPGLHITRVKTIREAIQHAFPPAE